MPPDARVSRRRFMDTMVAAPAAAALSPRTQGRAGTAGPTGMSGGQSAQVAAAPGGAPPDLARSVARSTADLGANFEAFQRLDRQTAYPASFLSGRFPTIDAFTANGRQFVLDGYGYRPERVDPAPEVIDRFDGPDYIREKVVFSTTPTFRVPAYVFIPKGLRGRAPAIVDLHSHGGMFLFGKEKVIDFGHNHPAMVKYHADNYESRPTATELVKRGYVVITIDAFMFGERRVLMDNDLGSGWERSNYSLDDVTRLNRVCASKESTLAKSLTVLGTSWPAIVAWDDMRTVDYLISRPEVDPARVGCVGVSFGGWRSLWLAALDTRIAAGCVVGFMSTIRSMLQRHIDTHSWVHFVPGLHRHLDLPDVATLTAPRPLLVQQCRRDGLYPVEGMEAAVRTIAEVYRRANLADRFSALWYDVPHEFNRQMQDDAFAWMDRQLLG